MLWSLILIQCLISLWLSKFRDNHFLPFILSLVYLKITFLRLLLLILVIVSNILTLVKNSIILKSWWSLCTNTNMILLIINLRIKVLLKIIYLWDIIRFLLLWIKTLYFLEYFISRLVRNNLCSNRILNNHSSFSLVLNTSQVMILWMDYLIYFKLIILILLNILYFCTL